MARILYQTLVEPVLPPSLVQETVMEAKWHQPLSTPVRRAGLTTAVIVASGLFSAPFTPAETVTLDKWYQPLSVPVQPRPVAEEAALSFVEAAPFAESVTADRWFQPLSTPTRRPYAPPGHIGFAQAAPFAETVTLGWFEPFGTPVRRPYAAPGHVAFTEAAPFGESVTADRWVEPLSVPVLRGGLSVAVRASAGGTWGNFTPDPVPPDTSGDRFVGFVANTGRLMSSRF